MVDSSKIRIVEAGHSSVLLEEGWDFAEAEKVRICKHSYDILVTDMGLTAEDIIFDPNSLTVATGIEEHNIYGVDFINARRIIKEYADPVH
ncbi:Pterin binding enzyme [Phytophthora infestans]|uniref:Pterin binding enzyme n=1 Tax=Phytophthora infestans TaxID=4787 RepID=A0A833S8B2_PHYIN|nr:Pterin binding enzyme [Phytophthora infestans]KAF4138954.1 Pterin binding enzyme [Phytophthora infestans]